MLHLVDISLSPEMEVLVHLLFSVLKYVIVAGAGYFLFYVWKKRDWMKHKIQQKMPSDQHIRHEIFWSVMSRLIFGVVILFISYNIGLTKFYFDLAEYGMPYFIASVVGLIFLHDTYFYFAHWLMHKPLLYKHVHKVHHHSTNPTPLASFSFHPSEALVEVAIFPLLIFLIPLHPLALVSLMIFSIVFNVYGHSGFELMPRWWVANPVTKYLNTSTHHNLHHKEFNYNFGLYFNHWDRIMGTLDPEYDEKFYAIKDRSLEIENEELVAQPA